MNHLMVIGPVQGVISRNRKDVQIVVGCRAAVVHVVEPSSMT